MRVLFIRIGAMGDVLHALPAVSAVRVALPNAHLAWAIEPRWQPLLSGSTGQSSLLDTFHRVETRQWKQSPLSLATARSIVSLRSQLRAGNYDLAIDLQGSIRSALVGRLAGTPDLVGQKTPRETPARLLYHRQVPLTAPHVIDQAAELVSAALHLPLQRAPITLPVDPAAERWWRQQAFGETSFVLLVPQAGWGAKQWPADRFGLLAQQLTQAGYRVLVNQVHAADPLAAAVVAASRETAEPVTADLVQLIALIRRAALVIAGDTGPTHLAAALGRPVLALFGPTDPARTGPRGPSARVLRDPASVTDHSRLAATEGGLLQITTETVLEAAFALLHQSPPEPNV